MVLGFWCWDIGARVLVGLTAKNVSDTTIEDTHELSGDHPADGMLADVEYYLVDPDREPGTKRAAGTAARSDLDR